MPVADWTNTKCEYIYNHNKRYQNWRSYLWLNILVTKYIDTSKYEYQQLYTKTKVEVIGSVYFKHFIAQLLQERSPLLLQQLKGV